MSQHVKQVLLLGEDAPKLKAVLGDVVPITDVTSMEQAIVVARQHAQSGDAVLLSPACASFDMFSGFEHRGDVFSKGVKRMVQEDER